MRLLRSALHGLRSTLRLCRLRALSLLDVVVAPLRCLRDLLLLGAALLRIHPLLGCRLPVVLLHCAVVLLLLLDVLLLLEALLL